MSNGPTDNQPAPAHQPEAVVALRSVSKIFGGQVKAVDEVNLQIHAGQTVALLGPSGCGKTTTLRLINRLTEPDSGTVLVRGHPVREQREETLRRSIGYVIQEGGLFPHLSVADNVATVPRLLRWPADQIRRRVTEVLDLVSLAPEDFSRRRPSELSGGQRQRVGVARALASDPDLLLMDEPFAAIDPVTRESLHEEFLSLQGRLKKTVVIVTHDMNEAGKLANRIVLMDQGRIAQQGTLRDMLFRPANEFVSSFFGPHRQQMLLETLRLDDLLDEVDPTPSAAGASVVELAGGAIVRSVLGALVQSASDALLIVESDRHEGQTFSLQQVRSRLFDGLAD